MGRTVPPLILEDEERQTLEQWTRRAKTAQALALRARTIMGCARRTDQHGGSRPVTGIQTYGREVAVDVPGATTERALG